MFGRWLEMLKNPKQPAPWIVTGWVLCGIGYAIFANWGVEPMGQIIAFLGLLAICLTLIRLSVTRLVYAILCGILVVLYVGFYVRSSNWQSSNHKADVDAPDRERIITQWLPTYAEGKMEQKAMAVLFSPAAMGNVILSGKLKGSDIEQWVTDYDKEHLKQSDIGGLIKDGKKRRGK